MVEQKKQRVMAYVDGFNLYFGMIESVLDTKWLDIRKLVQSRLQGNQELVGIKYFTSNITNDPPKEARQRTYIDALETTDILIIRGKYESKEVNCTGCGKVWFRSNEKKTDVNIATALIFDALKDKFDVAILISGDSDLVPAINMVHDEFPPKIVTVFFPPNRHNTSVASAATGSMILGKPLLKKCQFDEEVIKSDGFILRKPSTWG